MARQKRDTGTRILLGNQDPIVHFLHYFVTRKKGIYYVEVACGNYGVTRSAHVIKIP
jgi:hypothetical protein